MESEQIEVYTKSMIRGEVMEVSVWRPFGDGCVKSTLWKDGVESANEFNGMFRLRKFIREKPNMMQIVKSDYEEYKKSFRTKESG